MSIEAITYIKTLPVVNPRSRLVLGAIAENTYNDSGKCRVGQDVISYETKMPDRTVRYHLRRLKLDGIVTIERPRDEHGHRKTNVIEIVGFLDWLAMIRRGGKATNHPAAKIAAGGRKQPAASGKAIAARQRQLVAGPYKESRTSKFRTSLPQTPEAETGSGERAGDEQLGDKRGTDAGQPVDDLPVERATWLKHLAADGDNPAIVETVIRPLLATLTVPRTVAPLPWLRLWRDAAAKLDLTPALAAEFVRRIAVDRVRDLPWPKDLAKIADETRAAMTLTLPAGDPRWAAWLAHDLTNPAKSAFARAVQRNRWSYQAEAPWPPATPAPEVERLPLGWRVAAGTPEHAAWLAAIGCTNPAKAQGIEIAKRELTQLETRWPSLGGAAAACMTASHRGQREATGPASHAARCAR